MNLVGKTTKLFFLAFHSTHAISTLDALREIPQAGVQLEWRHFRVSVVAASYVLPFSPLSFSCSRCIFLPAKVKLFQDANGRFIRSRKRIDRAIRFRKITKPPALRRVPNMKYVTVKWIHRILQIMWLVIEYLKSFDAHDLIKVLTLVWKTWLYIRLIDIELIS